MASVPRGIELGPDAELGQQHVCDQLNPARTFVRESCKLAYQFRDCADVDEMGHPCTGKVLVLRPQNSERQAKPFACSGVRGHRTCIYGKCEYVGCEHVGTVVLYLIDGKYRQLCAQHYRRARRLTDVSPEAVDVPIAETGMETTVSVTEPPPVDVDTAIAVVDSAAHSSVNEEVTQDSSAGDDVTTSSPDSLNEQIGDLYHKVAQVQAAVTAIKKACDHLLKGDQTLRKEVVALLQPLQQGENSRIQALSQLTALFRAENNLPEKLAEAVCNSPKLAEQLKNILTVVRRLSGEELPAVLKQAELAVKQAELIDKRLKIDPREPNAFAASLSAVITHSFVTHPEWKTLTKTIGTIQSRTKPLAELDAQLVAIVRSLNAAPASLDEKPSELAVAMREWLGAAAANGNDDRTLPALIAREVDKHLGARFDALQKSVTSAAAERGSWLDKVTGWSSRADESPTASAPAATVISASAGESLSANDEVLHQALQLLQDFDKNRQLHKSLPDLFRLIDDFARFDLPEEQSGLRDLLLGKLAKWQSNNQIRSIPTSLDEPFNDNNHLRNQTVLTSRSDLNGKLAGVFQPGYIMTLSSGREMLLQQAYVDVYHCPEPPGDRIGGP